MAKGSREREISAMQEDSMSRDESCVLSPPQAQQQEGSAEQQQVVQRSRWQAVLLEAGGISAAVSEESMRRLQYCLQWLQVSTLRNSIDLECIHSLVDAVCNDTH